VLVVLGGGTPPRAIVTALLDAVRDTGAPCTVRTIVADPPPAPAPAPGQHFAFAPPGPDLLERAAEADLVISAAGVTLLELCCIGVPTALVRLADNQAAGYRSAVDRGLAAGLGAAGDPHSAREVLATLLTDGAARRRLASSASQTVDGQGAARVLDAVEEARGDRHG
jgi:UDP-N-acetylglucosamine:LPS N-acetylglucosamine transferase